jgi:hypothetical protein
VIGIDHAYIEDEAAAQEVYDALGALDARCPDALVPLGLADLRQLVEAAERRLRLARVPPGDQALAGAVRRVRHVLERAERDGAGRGLQSGRGVR